MKQLEELLQQLRELNQVHAGSSFTPFGGVGGAHSFPGPEPGKLSVVPTGIEVVSRGFVHRENPGQEREGTRSERRWQRQRRFRRK
jgi:hypothetical protein